MNFKSYAVSHNFLSLVGSWGYYICVIVLHLFQYLCIMFSASHSYASLLQRYNQMFNEFAQSLQRLYLGILDNLFP